MHRTLSLVAIAVSVIACGDTPAVTDPIDSIEPTPQQFSTASVVTMDSFHAVAQCSADIGFDILFGGDRVLLTQVTTDRSGKKHTTLHFRTQDFKGWRMPEPTPPTSAPDFDVQGGAEMFAIQTDAEGTVRIRIHQGNLVFESLSDDSRVVAHHTIRQVPGTDPVSFWSCRIGG